ncbi:predicted protein [Chaetomium globosum CBS 148.51]|uniref:Uncharacterized protein n=1 Tax=Chaetomium globosum (strain ATCC 6205 / CBS 148.51 / DSM 1962 / NBRC 6347 / NRRL 1970) TaxID=306901 RepID=Q2H1R6_CHAGB|nr:uncharacterized protein CHGG_04280 [Chaetomium globosum CBS 148.51]EAQ87661.1 predicted protein [Chaetomium globosum CBS 148.51]
MAPRICASTTRLSLPEHMQSYKDEWTEVINRIRSQPNIREVSVTFLSCCRGSAVYDTWMPWSWPGEDIRLLQSSCLALEEHFISLLATCHGVREVTLRGNVPPSLGARLEQADTGLSIRLQAISKQMSAFIKGVEKETAEKNADAQDPSWTKQTPYLPLRYHPARNSSLHFVLKQTGPEIPTWSYMQERNEEAGVATGMERVSGPLFVGTWETVSEVFDFENTVAKEDDS